MRSPVSNTALAKASSCFAIEVSCESLAGSSLVRIIWGRDSNSSMIGLLVGNKDATPRSVTGMTYGFSMLSAGIISECINSVGFSVRNRGTSLTVTSLSRNCIEDSRLWTRSGIKIAWCTTKISLSPVSPSLS
jgi:hypothetical protein